MNALERPPATLVSPAAEWPRPRQRGGGETAAAYGFLAPNGIGFVAFTLIPIVASFVLSLFDWPLLNSPSYVGLKNYSDLATKDPVFGQVLLNTVSFVVGYVPFNILLSLGIAVWLSSKIRARNLFRIVFFLPVVTPMVANAMIWTLLYAPDTGVLDWFISTVFHVPGPNWLGSQNLAMPAMVAMSLWQGFGYNMLIFSAGLQVIPGDLYEAAALDGASAWRRFLNITLPLLTPFIFFGLVLTLITSFQVFTQPYVLTGGGPGVSTTTLVLYLYNNGFQYFRMGYASALAWILFLIIMAITIVQFVAQRRWVHYE
jgi:multiple sugar transport system permease protein